MTSRGHTARRPRHRGALMSTWATRLAVVALLSAALIPAAGVAAQPDVAAERARVVELDRALAAADAAAGAAAQAHNRALGRREAILVRIRITRRDIAETQHTLDASRAPGGTLE